MDAPNEALSKCDVCDPVFDRVVVSHIIAGPTRVMWTLMDDFTDDGPLEFQLQVGTTNNNDADDWEDVGLPVVDQYSATDDEQRVWGKTNFTHYRVKLTTSNGEYLSAPESGMGVLDRRSWRLARDMVRSKRQAMRVGDAGQRGYLLKRRWTGQDCPVCLDYQTKEVRNPQCTTCYGTGKKCGYFYPMSCVWAELAPRAKRTHLDEQRATVNDVVVSASMLMVDLLDEEDIWVADKTDDRYFVHKVSHTAEMRGVPITANVELRLVPFTHIAYAIPIPDQLRNNGVEE